MNQPDYIPYVEVLIGFPPAQWLFTFFHPAIPLIGLRIGIITVRSFVSKVVMVQIFREDSQEIPLFFLFGFLVNGWVPPFGVSSRDVMRLFL